ncbi:MAG TPA: D-2-hydroxyacid dehydrogenase [Spirochaetia bacterium]|nr:D-2-hydroxyacid dehydrogenase [Spirochaetia bacterium]
MLKVLVTVPTGEKDLAVLGDYRSRVELVVSQRPDPAAIESTEVFVTFGFDLTGELISRAANLRWVQLFRAGVDMLPLRDLLAREITVTTVSGIHAIPMAEHALAMIIMLAHKFHLFGRRQAQKKWNREAVITEAWEKTVGIIGTGHVGTEVAKKARALGMRSIGLNTRGTPVDGVEKVLSRDRMDQLLRESDFVVVTVPLTPATREFLGEREFTMMKPTASLINLARGEVIDEKALVRALQDGVIGGAGLDVFAAEPLPPDSPLWAMENVIITPHVSGISDRYVERGMAIFAENLAACLTGGRPVRNIVDLQRGY